MTPQPDAPPVTTRAPGSPVGGPERSARGGAVRRAWGRFKRSVHWRLVALFLLLALATTVVFVGGTRQWLLAGWRGLARPLVSDYVDRLAAEIGSPPSLARAQALTQRLPVAVRISGPVLTWDSHPDRGHRHGDGHGEGLAVLEGQAGDPGPGLLTRRSADGHVLVFGFGDWRWASGAVPGPGWRVLLALLLLTGLAYALVRRLLRPLDDIRQGVQRYGAGNFAQPIAQRRPDELGELAGHVNTMAANLQRMLEGQRGLLLAISHELRSPLTRARLHAELLDDGAERDALLHDLGEMRDLISDLLESERLALGAQALKTEACDLAALVRAQLAEPRAESRAKPLADQAAAARIQADLAEGLPHLSLDRSRVQLLLRNLLDNALRHGAGGPVQVGLRPHAGGVRLTVRDHGPGVAAAQRAQLAAPFFRVDAARSRDRGGVGLGLYLCRRVAESHGAELSFHDAAPGLLVQVDWPPMRPGHAD